jgi:hypothetical protein
MSYFDGMSFWILLELELDRMLFSLHLEHILMGNDKFSIIIKYERPFTATYYTAIAL